MDKNFLTPVPRTTLATDICKRLISHLVRGDWAEGDRIPSERELGNRLGVGRTSLREALKALEIMGLIETRVGEGTFACAKTEFLSRPLLWAIGSAQTDLRELIEARWFLEVELAALAAERATEENLNVLRGHLTQMEISKDNPSMFLEADLGFHLAVAQAAHNRILLKAVQLIRNLMLQWMAKTIRFSGTTSLASGQHAAIFRAIEEKNPTAARKVMGEHLDSMAKLLHDVSATSGTNYSENEEATSEQAIGLNQS
jgi:GntR family transcriptional regulator, transcriptional repressor for pyruvate dehydrogenase complex